VKVRNVSETTPLDTKTLKAGWSSVVSSELPQEWANAVIKMSFNDNFDKAETVIVVKKGVPTAAGAFFSARVENNKLFITTR